MNQRETVVVGGGCFWCLEAIFVELKGVESVLSGYAGGTAAEPSYEQVSAGRTGHAEVVQITFDPQVISVEELLRVFFSIHNPTTINRQGPDVGPQYRSVIVYNSPEQKAAAGRVIGELTEARLWDEPIITELMPLTAFYPAEEYHQHYYERQPDQPYCRAIIEPKLAKFRRENLEKLRKSA